MADEVKTHYSYDPKGNNVITCNLNNTKPDRILWGWPDRVEMTDADGNVHVYSIIEILDGLTALAKSFKQ